MEFSISEVLKMADEEQDWETKLMILRTNKTAALQDVLIGGYDPRVKWLLPYGPMPYTPTQPDGYENNLQSMTRTFYMYTAFGGVQNMTQKRREELFCQLLEAVDPEDAKLLIAMKDKNIPSLYPTLTPGLIAAAFPNMLDAVKPDMPQEPQIRDSTAVSIPEAPVPTLPKNAAPEPPTKRKRGRPRKNPLPEAKTAPVEVKDTVVPQPTVEKTGGPTTPDDIPPLGSDYGTGFMLTK